MKYRIVFIFGLTIAAFLALAGKQEEKPQQVMLTTIVPVLDTVTGYPWELTKEGVTIKLVPLPFEPKVIYHHTLREKPKGLLSITVGNGVTYLVTDEPTTYVLKPDSLTFQLHVTNHMNHVLRFAGCLLSFQADGKSLPLNTRTQNDLLGAIILPQGSLDLTIMGPAANAEHVGDSTKTVLDVAKTIIFSLYDVTTEVDAANNPTKKATFEWIFANNPETVSDLFPKTVTESKMLPADAAKLDNTWYWK